MGGVQINEANKIVGEDKMNNTLGKSQDKQTFVGESLTKILLLSVMFTCIKRFYPLDDKKNNTIKTCLNCSF